MRTEQVIQKIKEIYKEYQSEYFKFPALYKEPDEDLLAADVAVLKKYYDNMTLLEYYAGGIHAEFMLDNDVFVSVIKHKTTNYEWEIMSPAIIRNDDALISHLTNDDVIECLDSISKGHLI